MNGHKNRVLAVVLALGLGAYATEAAAAAKKISTCTTITNTGLHVLTKNIDLPAGGDCLVLQQDFVTLDFRGFAIRGDGVTGSGVVDDCTLLSCQGITIRGGTITGFLNGILLTQTVGNTGAVVERMRIIDNVGNGITVGNASIVTHNVVVGNTGIGIQTGTGSLIADNVARNNDDDGIRAGAGSTVRGNTARFNVGDGIDAFACPSNVIGNTATANGDNIVTFDLRLTGGAATVCTNIDNSFVTILP